MAQYRGISLFIFAIVWLLTLSSCSVNPFRSDNELTGSAAGTAIGAGVGAGTAYLAGASKAEIALAGLLGAAAGYYVTSLPFNAGGITHVGGKVYTLGDFVMIEIQSDKLFEVNTSDLLPEAAPILDSVVSVLKRYPNSNIMISGNTNGYYSNRFERALSENRARQVAAYLWAQGINNFTGLNLNYASIHGTKTYTRHLSYVGYGSYFPISSTLTTEGRRENDRIQITVYPKTSKLHLHKCGKVFSAQTNELELTDAEKTAELNTSFKGDNLPENEPVRGDEFNDPNLVSGSLPPSTIAKFKPDDSDLKAEKWETYNNRSLAMKNYKGE